MEQEFHRWLKARSSESDPRIVLGIGDDAAIMAGSSECSVIATDTIAEGTHFDLGCHSLELVGRKALAVNLSDLAAMAARPVATVLTFLLPRQFGLEEAIQIYNGVQNLAAEFGVSIIGGDTNSWGGPLVVGATAIGHRPTSQVGWLLNGLQVGDAIVVSGSFGGSIHGRHMTFTPRVELALYLSNNYQINAATDVTDSLSLDLNSMASSSGIGIDLDLDAIPVSRNVQTSDASAALQHALTDGEDFELAISISKSQLDRLMTDDKVAEKLTVVGCATDRHDSLRSMSPDGNWEMLDPKGYVH